MTARVAVVAYPIFAAPDLALIQGIRGRHDPQAAMLAPHVTPLGRSWDDVLEAVESTTCVHRAFEFDGTRGHFRA